MKKSLTGYTWDKYLRKCFRYGKGNDTMTVPFISRSKKSSLWDNVPRWWGSNIKLVKVRITIEEI